VPNITPDRETGLGGWSEEQITDYLETGNKPTETWRRADGRGHPGSSADTRT